MTKQLKANNRELGKEAKSYKKAIRNYEKERLTGNFLKKDTEEDNFSRKLRQAYLKHTVRNYTKTPHPNPKGKKSRLGRYLGT